MYVKLKIEAGVYELPGGASLFTSGDGVCVEPAFVDALLAQGAELVEEESSESEAPRKHGRKAKADEPDKANEPGKDDESAKSEEKSEALTLTTETLAGLQS